MRRISLAIALLLGLIQTHHARGATLEEHWQTARSQYDSHQYQAAAETLEKLLKEYPDHWQARPIGAWFYWEASKNNAGQDRVALEKKAENMILDGLKDSANLKSWVYEREVGDFYRLRVGSTTKAYPYYQKSVEYFESANQVQKAALLDRLARSSEELGRKGDAVTASCKALELDPEDKMAKNRIKNLAGNCTRKGINLKMEGESETEPAAPKPAEESHH